MWTVDETPGGKINDVSTRLDGGGLTETDMLVEIDPLGSFKTPVLPQAEVNRVRAILGESRRPPARATRN